MKTYCPSCGEEILRKASFCPSCGHKSDDQDKKDSNAASEKLKSSSIDFLIAGNLPNTDYLIKLKKRYKNTGDYP